MLDDSIKEFETRSHSRIAAANSADGLEAARVEALGRKAGLNQFSRELGSVLLVRWVGSALPPAVTSPTRLPKQLQTCFSAR